MATNPALIGEFTKAAEELTKALGGLGSAVEANEDGVQSYGRSMTQATGVLNQVRSTAMHLTTVYAQYNQTLYNMGRNMAMGSDGVARLNNSFRDLSKSTIFSRQQLAELHAEFSKGVIMMGLGQQNLQKLIRATSQEFGGQAGQAMQAISQMGESYKNAVTSLTGKASGQTDLQIQMEVMNQFGVEGAKIWMRTKEAMAGSRNELERYSGPLRTIVNLQKTLANLTLGTAEGVGPGATAGIAAGTTALQTGMDMFGDFGLAAMFGVPALQKGGSAALRLGKSFGGYLKGGATAAAGAPATASSAAMLGARYLGSVAVGGTIGYSLQNEGDISNTRSGNLKYAGGVAAASAVGFAMGGPAGAMLAGFSAAIGSIVKMHKMANDIQKDVESHNAEIAKTGDVRKTAAYRRARAEQRVENTADALKTLQSALLTPGYQMQRLQIQAGAIEATGGDVSRARGIRAAQEAPARQMYAAAQRAWQQATRGMSAAEIEQFSKTAAGIQLIQTMTQAGVAATQALMQRYMVLIPTQLAFAAQRQRGRIQMAEAFGVDIGQTREMQRVSVDREVRNLALVVNQFNKIPEAMRKSNPQWVAEQWEKVKDQAIAAAQAVRAMFNLRGTSTIGYTNERIGFGLQAAQAMGAAPERIRGIESMQAAGAIADYRTRLAQFEQARDNARKLKESGASFEQMAIGAETARDALRQLADSGLNATRAISALYRVELTSGARYYERGLEARMTAVQTMPVSAFTQFSVMQEAYQYYGQKQIEYQRHYMAAAAAGQVEEAQKSYSAMLDNWQKSNETWLNMWGGIAGKLEAELEQFNILPQDVKDWMPRSSTIAGIESAPEMARPFMQYGSRGGVAALGRFKRGQVPSRFAPGMHPLQSAGVPWAGLAMASGPGGSILTPYGEEALRQGQVAYEGAVGESAAILGAAGATLNAADVEQSMTAALGRYSVNDALRVVIANNPNIHSPVAALRGF